MLTLRSLLFNVLMVSTVVIFAVLSLFTLPFSTITRYRFISLWARLQIWFLKVVCSLTYRVEGNENLPSGPAIILAKHQSVWETLAFQCIFPPQVWVLKRELLLIPFFGWGLAMTQPIAIDRGSGARALEQIVKQGRARLESGRWVVVFPEGTRVGAGQSRRHGIGGAVLAAETGYPVVPVAHNAGSFWPRHGFIKRPGVIRVVIGPVIESRGRSAQQIRDIAEQWMQEVMTDLDQGPGHGKSFRQSEIA